MDSRYAGLLRTWRRRRRMARGALAQDAAISARHLGALESGRCRPDRATVLALADCLDIPLRDRNQMLAVAGFDPEFPERRFADPDFASARRDVAMILEAHAPGPALAIDRHWTIIAANASVPWLFAGTEPGLLHPPANFLRLCLHPAGIAGRIVNLPAWRACLIARLRRQVDLTGDPVLIELLEEVRDYPVSAGHRPAMGDRDAELAVPLRLATIDGVLTFIGTTTTFVAPADITLAEISIEAFLPGDARTAELLRMRAGCNGGRDDGRVRRERPAAVD